MAKMSKQDQIASDLFKAIEQICTLAANKSPNIVDGMIAVANGTQAAIGTMGKLMCGTYERHTDERLDTCYRFALLALGRMTQKVTCGGSHLLYHLGLLADAYQDYVKLYGVAPDDSLNPPMLRAIKDEEAVAKARLMEAAHNQQPEAANVINFGDYIGGTAN